MGTRWALLVEYEGTGFAGWQRQTNGPSIQAAIEEALGRLTEHPVRVLGAGRTDAAVHALGQVAAFTTEKPLRADNIVRGGNAYLPPQIRLRSARQVSPAFNPRREALGRLYRYRLAQGGVPPALERAVVTWTSSAVDWARVAEALAFLQGRHDFAAFRSSQCTARRTVLTLERAEVEVIPRGPDQECGVMAEFHFGCRSFLHNMVRMLVGAALEVGRKRLDLQKLETILQTGARAGVRFPTAPAHGLCLMSVRYPAQLGLWQG